MKKILKTIFVVLFTLTICELTHDNVFAMEESAYKTITNRNIIYVVEKDGAFSHSWQFSKNQYKDGIDFSLKLLDSSPYIKNIDKTISDNVKKQYLFFEHHGNLPTDALMKVKVDDNFTDGEKLYLYYYNDVTDKLEFISRNLIVKNGAVEFKIKHCSDYILTGSIVKEAVDNPQSMAIVIISLIILGVILVAATLFNNSKK